MDKHVNWAYELWRLFARSTLIVATVILAISGFLRILFAGLEEYLDTQLTKHLTPMPFDKEKWRTSRSHSGMIVWLGKHPEFFKGMSKNDVIKTLGEPTTYCNLDSTFSAKDFVKHPVALQMNCLRYEEWVIDHCASLSIKFSLKTGSIEKVTGSY